MTGRDDDDTRVDDPVPGDEAVAEVERTAALSPRGRRSIPPDGSLALPPTSPQVAAGEVEVPLAAAEPARPRRDSGARTPGGLHVQATQQLARDVDSRGSLQGPTGSPVEALRGEEVERTRVFLQIALGIVIGALAAAAVAGGDRTGKLVLLVSCLWVVGVASWMLWVTRDRAAYTEGRATFAALGIALGATGSCVYWGVASPASGLLIYGIYFFSLGEHKRITLLLYVECAVLHGALSLAIITGVLDDRGLISMGHLRTIDQVSLTSMVQFLYLVAYLTGRATRRTTLEAVTRLERAVRSVAQREAMLQEARQELDRALKIGGPGRYTDQVIGGYQLGALIGRGGMGEVYEGTPVDGGAPAAVKLLHPSTLADPRQVSRFVRETEVASQLDCPHVVRVLAVGTTSGEVPYLAMERLRGTDLAQQLRRRRTLPADETVALVRQLALGLEAARTAGIVHRDLKPHNVFAAEQGVGPPQWKILDFGVSKLASGKGTLTRGQVVGTPAYMAPEQARGEDVDARADVYALAAIAYRVLAGQPAFTGKDVPSTLYDVVYKMPTQPSLLTALPADVDRALAIGLAKDKAERFQTAPELAEALAAALGEGLPPALRRRADELIERWAWGARR